MTRITLLLACILTMLALIYIAALALRKKR